MSLLLLATLAYADPFATHARVEVLANGLTVIVEPQTRTDTVALHLYHPVGARDELPGEYGCAHLFEHLMFEGSRNVPGNRFDAWLTEAGGENNAWTSEDETAYYMLFPSGALDLALFIESDRVGFLSDALTQENLTNQQGVVLQERNSGYDEPGGKTWDAMNLLRWPAEHPYGHTVIGTVADVSGFKIDQVRDFWDRHYRTQGAVLTIVGNVDPDEALRAARTWFSDVPDRGPRAARPAPPDANRGSVHGVIEDATEEHTLVAAFPTVPADHADAPALELLSYTLSNGRGTRLDDAVYYNSDLATEASAVNYPMDISGTFLFWLSTERGSVAPLEKAMWKVIKSASKRGFSEAELQRAKKAWRDSTLDGLEAPHDRAVALTECYKQYGKADCLSDEAARIEAVTVDDLERVAATWLIPDRFSTLSVVPMGGKGARKGAVPVELP